MENTPPVLATLLDLGSEQSKEVDQASARFLALAAMAAKEPEHLSITSPEAVRLYGDQLGRLPEMARVMLGRLEQRAPHARVSPLMLGMAAALCPDATYAVLWSQALAAWWERTRTPASLMNVWVSHMGTRVPTPSAVEALWAAQKVGGENWLDRPEAWTTQALTAGMLERVPFARSVH